MSELLAKLRVLVESKETHIRKLAEDLGCDPANFYIGTDLSGVDLRGQDLRGVGLEGTNLQDASFDLTTKFDDDIERVLRDIKVKKYLEVSVELLKYSQAFFSVEKFTSRGWFIKRIVPPAAQEIAQHLDQWVAVIEGSPEFSSFFNASHRKKTELILNYYDHNEGSKIGKKYGGYGASLTALIIVGLMHISGVRPQNVKLPVTRDFLLKQFEENEKLSAQYLGRRIKS